MLPLDRRQFLSRTLSSLPFLAAGLPLSTASATTLTQTWGSNGSLWDPNRLPDFSFAGYKFGLESLPNRTPQVWVTDYGAVPGTNSTTAFQQAIAANPGKCIGIPAGNFYLTNRLHLTAPGTVLKGAGRHLTNLRFTRGLQQIDPRSAQTNHGSTTTPWSWSGGLITIGTSLSNQSGYAIAHDVPKGSNTVTLYNAQNVSAGDLILLRQLDDSAGGLTRHLYRNDPGSFYKIKGQVAFYHLSRVEAINGNTLTLERPLPADFRKAWNAHLIPFQPNTTECGVEDLRVAFHPRTYRGHWKEDGLNAFDVKGANNWLRRITIENCDSGIFVSGQLITISGVSLVANRPSEPGGRTGHHGISVSGQDCLITRFRIGTKFYHDLTLSKNSYGNVFSNGSGVNLNLDHHCYAPYHNLFTDLHLGTGSRPWLSGGGGGVGRHTAGGAVFWNLNSNNPIPLPNADFGPSDMIFVGLNLQSNLPAHPSGWIVENLAPDTFSPPDLHYAQLRRRSLLSQQP